MRWKFSLSILLIAISSIACKPETIKTENSTELLEKPWQFAQNIVNNITVPSFPDKEYNIIDFGAISDESTDCSKAINEAILKCSSDGGGKVIIPQGVFLTGAIHLKSNVNLHISEGAVLLFSTDKSKYLPVVHTRFEGMECMNYSPLLYAYKQENIAITGKGKIDGQGHVWWHWKGTNWQGSVEIAESKNKVENQDADNKRLYEMVESNTPVEQRVFGEGHYLRPSFIQPYLCKNVLIEGITIVGAPMWVIHPVLSEDITVKNVRIESLGPNNDGCDPESCKNILIDSCYFDTGDDCIAIKSGRNNDGRRIGVASENIVVRNSYMVEGHGGVVMGSEISGDVRYVFAENCVMDSPNLDRAIRIKSNSVRGGVIEHIYVRNIEVKQVREAILKINMYYSNERGENIPSARNIYLENVNGYNSKYGVWIEAYEELPANNIVVKDCNFSNVAQKNHILNAENISFQNLVVNNEIVTE